MTVLITSVGLEVSSNESSQNLPFAHRWVGLTYSVPCSYWLCGTKNCSFTWSSRGPGAVRGASEAFMSNWEEQKTVSGASLHTHLYHFLINSLFLLLI